MWACLDVASSRQIPLLTHPTQPNPPQALRAALSVALRWTVWTKATRKVPYYPTPAYLPSPYLAPFIAPMTPTRPPARPLHGPFLIDIPSITTRKAWRHAVRGWKKVAAAPGGTAGAANVWLLLATDGLVFGLLVLGALAAAVFAAVCALAWPRYRAGVVGAGTVFVCFSYMHFHCI